MTPPTGAWPMPWRLSSPTTPGASTPPSGASSTTGAATWALRALPADPLTVARYLAVRAGSGASVATLRLAASAIAKAQGLADWEFFSGHSGRVGMALRMAQNGAPTHEIERQGRWKQGAGMVGRYNPRRVRRVGTAVSVIRVWPVV